MAGDGDDLEATLPLGSPGVRMPSNPRLDIAASQSPMSTLAYGDSPKQRGDIAVIDLDSELQEQLRTLLEPRGYRVFALKDATRVVALCKQISLLAVLSDAGGSSTAALVLRDGLGDDAPPVIAMGGGQIRDGVVAVVPKRVDEALFEAIDAAAGGD
jgi:hypothetical protein